MLKVEKINLNALSIYLMETTDFQLNFDCSFFTASEENRCFGIKHPQKKIEFIASRYLKYTLFGKAEITYDSTGAPFIHSNEHISLSHCATHVALAHSNSHLIGIDLEPINEKAVRVAEKFCSEEEKHYFDCKNPSDMSLLWSFKETLYKLSDRNELHFLTDIRVDKNENAYIGHVLTSNGVKKFPLFYTLINSTYLTSNSFDSF